MRVADLIPYFNEKITVASAVQKFRASVPLAQIYVYDRSEPNTLVHSSNGRFEVTTVEPRS